MGEIGRLPLPDPSTPRPFSASCAPLWEYFAKLTRWYWLAKSQLIYRQFLGALGRRSQIIKPLKLRNPQNIYIGNHVTINSFSWLLTLSLLSHKAPRLSIGDGSEIGHFNHITCVNSVQIGCKVLTADGVHISDNGHGFEDPTRAIIDQPVTSKGPVSIGEGTWLGENVSVLSCCVGRNCIVGANAVVTRDIPDFSIAAGIPARIIRRMNRETKIWEQVN